MLFSSRWRRVRAQGGVEARVFSTALLVVAILVLGALPAAAPAHATTVAECIAQIQALSTTTSSVQISGRNAERDRQGLVGKLAEAVDKLNQGKPLDAIAKLNDFIQRVTQLAAQGRIQPGDANTLLAGANSAISCIRAIGT